jgi:hypothetical protein
MARTIGALCTFIVGLQILVGVPLVVCAAFFCLTNGPITVEVHAGHGHAPQFIVHGATIPPPDAPRALAPPPNAIPATATPTSFDNPILQSRAEHGSPLAGTMLESNDPNEEQSNFVAALEKAVAEHSCEPRQAVCASGEPCQATAEAHRADLRSDTAILIVQHLYVIADIDEHAGNYDRADQWRAQARQIREGDQETSAPSVSPASVSLPVNEARPTTGN